MKTLPNKSAVAVKPKFALTEIEKARLIKEYESNPVSSGRTQYLRYLHGEKLTYMEAVHAKCAECCCGYVDGRQDCGIPACPLYAFMPYRGQLDHEMLVAESNENNTITTRQSTRCDGKEF